MHYKEPTRVDSELVNKEVEYHKEKDKLIHEEEKKRLLKKKMNKMGYDEGNTGVPDDEEETVSQYSIQRSNHNKLENLEGRVNIRITNHEF